MKDYGDAFRSFDPVWKFVIVLLLVNGGIVVAFVLYALAWLAGFTK